MAERKIMSELLDLRQYSRSAAAEIAALKIPEIWKEGKYGSAAIRTFIAVSELGLAAGIDTVALLPKIGVRAGIAMVSALDDWGQKRRGS